VQAIGVAAWLALAAMAQVTIAPLFPVGSANFDFVLISLGAVMAFRGPRSLLVGMPFAAICLAFATNRAPGLMVLAYLPMLPAALWLAESGPPMTRSMQVFSATVVTGMFSRALLGMGAISGGAEPAMGTLLLGIVLPGVFLDLALLSLAYFPSRLLGLETGEITLQPGRY
jgi:hypothetical protein